MKWFRFWTDTLDDVKILQLSDYEYRIWTYLLAIASEVNSMSGECQINVKSMSLRCRTQVNHFLKALETFQRVGLITVSDEGYPIITNWKKRQYKSDDVTARVHKHREVTAKRNVSCNVSETDQITDTDTDTDKHIKKPKKISSVLPEWIKKETWDAYREMRTRKRAPLTDRAATLIIKELEKLKLQGQSVEDVLNQSIMKSWTGVFPISQGGNGNGRRPDATRRDRIPEISTPPEWKGGDVPEVTEADRKRILEQVKGFTDRIG